MHCWFSSSYLARSQSTVQKRYRMIKVRILLARSSHK